MSFSFSIKKNLPSFEKKAFEKGVSLGMLAAAKFVTADAKKRVPVKSGDLKNSINEQGKFTRYKIGSQLHYAPYVEYGTKNQTPKPYLRPAAFDNVQTITKIISKFLGRFI